MLASGLPNHHGSDSTSGRHTEVFILLACGLYYAANVYMLWDWPSVDGFPAIERYLDPGFLANDFYTNTGTGYNVDTFLAVVFGGLQKLTGVSYVFWLGALNLLRCLAWPWCIFLLFHALSSNRKVGLVGAVLGTVSIFEIPNLLAWSWVWGDPSTALFAISLIVLAWVSFLRRLPWLSMLLMACAVMFHPLMVVHGGVFIALIYFVDFTREEKISAILSPMNLVGGLVFAAAFGFQYIALSAGADEKIASDLYAKIIAHERHPGDFLPSLFNRGEWAEAGLAGVVAAAILFVRKSEFQRWRLIIAGLVTYVIICACGSLFVEVWPVRFFIELIPFRSIILGAPLILFVYAVFAASELSQSRYVSFLGTVLLFYLYALPEWLGVPNKLIVLAIVVWILGNLRSIHSVTQPVDDYITHKLNNKTAPILVASFIAVLSLPVLAVRAPQIVAPNLENQHPVYQWLVAETSVDAVILLDQYANYAFLTDIDPQRVRLVARRAVVASKDFPFLDRDILPWYERWSIALNHGAYDFINQADASELNRIDDAFNYDFVIRDRPLESHTHYELAVQFSDQDGWAPVYVYSRLSDLGEPSKSDL